MSEKVFKNIALIDSIALFQTIPLIVLIDSIHGSLTSKGPMTRYKGTSFHRCTVVWMITLILAVTRMDNVIMDN